MKTSIYVNDAGRTHAVLRPPSKPKMSDYDLTQVRIERVENGCTVECNFKMKPEVEKAMRGKSGRDYIDYDVRNTTEKHVFNNIGEAASFIEARLMGKDYGKQAKAK